MKSRFLFCKKKNIFNEKKSLRNPFALLHLPVNSVFIENIPYKLFKLLITDIKNGILATFKNICFFTSILSIKVKIK